MQKNIFQTFFVRLLSAVANFLLVLVVAKYLGPTSKGIASLLLTTVSFVVFFCSIIGGQSYVFLLPKLKFETLIIPAVLWSIIICLCTFVVLSFLDLSTFKHACLIAVIALLMSLLNVHTTIFLAKQRWGIYNLFQALPVVLTLLFTSYFFFVLHYKTINTYLYSIVFAYGFCIITSFWFIRKNLSFKNLSQSLSEVETLFKFGLSYQLVELLQLLNLRFYFYMLHHLQGNMDLGYFSVGVSLFESCWIFARSVQSIVYAKFVSSEFSTQIGNMVMRYVKISLLLSFVVCAVLFVLPDSFFTTIFGDSYSGINRGMKWFIPGVIAYNIYIILQTYYLTKAKYTALILMNLVGFIISLLSCYASIPNRFFSGAAGSASLSFIFCAVTVFILYCHDTRQSYRILIPTKKDALVLYNYAAAIFSKAQKAK